MNRVAQITSFVVLSLHFQYTNIAVASENLPSAESLKSLALDAHKEGHLQEALGHYSLLLRQSKDAESYLARAQVWIRLGEDTHAVQDCNAAIKIDAKIVQAYIYRSLAHANLGDYSHAIADVTKAIDLDSVSYSALLTRGLLWSKLGVDHLAIQDLSLAIATEPEKSRPYYARASSYYVLGETDKAMVDVHTAIANNPDNYRAFLLRGKLYEFRKEVEKAMTDYEQVLSIKLGNIDAMKSISRLIAENSDVMGDELVKGSRIANEVNEITNFTDWKNLRVSAKLLAARGKYEKASELQRAAIKSAPVENQKHLQETLQEYSELE